MPFEQRKYYDSSISQFYPTVFKTVLEQVRIYITRTLYSSEIQDDDSNLSNVINRRMILSDMDSSSEFNMRSSMLEHSRRSESEMRDFFPSNTQFPFTAFGIGDFEEDEVIQRALSYPTQYLPSIGRRVILWPIKQDVPMVSFFTDPEDYNIARTKLHTQNAALTRLYIPLKINGTPYNWPVDVGFEISKGSFAFSFEEYLRVNKIYDIAHPVTVRFYVIEIDPTDLVEIDRSKIDVGFGTTSKTGVDIEEDLDSEKTTFTLAAPPTITGTTPTDESTGVSTNTTITVEFSQKMDEESVIECLTVSPAFDYDYEFDADGDTLTIKPITALSAANTYTFTFKELCVKNDCQVYLQDDYAFYFTTA